MLGHGCFFVMTGRVQAIQVFFLLPGVRTWMPRDPSTPRLRRALPLVRRSFSECGQAGHDEGPNKAPNFMAASGPSENGNHGVAASPIALTLGGPAAFTGTVETRTASQ